MKTRRAIDLTIARASLIAGMGIGLVFDRLALPYDNVGSFIETQESNHGEHARGF
jgi:hypothetical protein